MLKSPFEENAKTVCAQTAKPFRAPFAATLAVAILSIATALFLQAESQRIAIEKQNRPQIQSTR